MINEEFETNDQSNVNGYTIDELVGISGLHIDEVRRVVASCAKLDDFHFGDDAIARLSDYVGRDLDTSEVEQLQDLNNERQARWEQEVQELRERFHRNGNA